MRRIPISGLLLALSCQAFAGPKDSLSLDQSLARLPKNLQLSESGPQRYRLTTDYVHLDATGNVESVERYTADYARGLPGGKVRWDHAQLAQAKGLDGPFSAGTPLAFMNGFSYKLNNLGDTFRQDFFAGFSNDMGAKSMIWDTHMFEAFAWNYLDKLKLNVPYRLKMDDAKFPQGGSFHNAQPELTWIGVSKRNGKPCALIQYEVFFNTLTFPVNGTLPFSAGSHYWGMIWVSLKDKQLEYATLRENVVGTIQVPGPNGKQSIASDVFRVATLQRTS